MLKLREKPGLQPKTGMQQLSRLQGNHRQDTGSCEQVPACYTSIRPSAHQRETVAVIAPDTPSARAAKRATHMAPKLARGSQWPVHQSDGAVRPPASDRCPQAAVGLHHATSQQGGGPRTWQRRPKTKQRHSVGAKQPAAQACHGSGRQRGAWVPEPGCLAQCAQGRAPLENIRGSRVLFLAV